MMASKFPPAQKTRQILELLRIKYEKPEWATFAEFGVASDFGGRRIDFLALNCWESKKFMRVAYEIKVTRQDFNLELEEPDKRNGAERIANQCYFAMPSGLVKVDEIPEGWGLMEMTKTGLKKRKNAKYRNDVETPTTFVLSLARRCVDGPSVLPKVVWLQAGQEVDAEGLVAAANQDMDQIKRRIRHELLDEVESSVALELAKLKKLSQYVQWNIGYDYDDPEKFLKWCKTHLNDERDRWIKLIFRRAQDLRDNIDELLSSEKEMK